MLSVVQRLGSRQCLETLKAGLPDRFDYYCRDRAWLVLAESRPSFFDELVLD